MRLIDFPANKKASWLSSYGSIRHSRWSIGYRSSTYKMLVMGWWRCRGLPPHYYADWFAGPCIATVTVKLLWERTSTCLMCDLTVPYSWTQVMCGSARIGYHLTVQCQRELRYSKYIHMVFKTVAIHTYACKRFWNFERLRNQSLSFREMKLNESKILLCCQVTSYTAGYTVVTVGYQ